MNARPLTDAEYDRIAGVLSRFRDQRAMNLEQLDGFFAALICSPDHVPPSEYLPEIWGGDMGDEEAFSTRQELQEFMDLVMRHWNIIADTLQSGDVFLPLLLEDEEGIAHANDWARGFMRAMELRKEDWADLFARIPQMRRLPGEVRARFRDIVQRNSRDQRGWRWMVRRVKQTVPLSGSHLIIASN